MLNTAIHWNPSPILIDFGAIAIRYYSLMFVFAFLVGIYIEKKVYKKDGVSEDLVDSLFVYVALAVLLGARLGEVFFYSWDYYKDHLMEILLPIQFKPFKIIGFSGLASHGAALGVIISVYLFKRYKLREKSYLWILDRVVLAVPIGGAFVRFGNLMNSEIVGKYTNSDSGFIFQRLNETEPRYPTQIFEAIGYVLVFFVLWFIYWKTDKKHKEGYLFGVFMMLLWAVRFIVEFWKEPQDGENLNAMLDKGQILSIPFILIGAFFVIRHQFKKV